MESDPEEDTKFKEEASKLDENLKEMHKKLQEFDQGEKECRAETVKFQKEAKILREEARILYQEERKIRQSHLSERQAEQRKTGESNRKVQVLENKARNLETKAEEFNKKANKCRQDYKQLKSEEEKYQALAKECRDLANTQRNDGIKLEREKADISRKIAYLYYKRADDRLKVLDLHGKYCLEDSEITDHNRKIEELYRLQVLNRELIEDCKKQINKKDDFMFAPTDVINNHGHIKIYQTASAKLQGGMWKEWRIREIKTFAKIDSTYKTPYKSTLEEERLDLEKERFELEKERFELEQNKRGQRRSYGGSRN